MPSNSELENQYEAILRKPINGQTLKRLVEASLNWLRVNQQIVNALNVFPVPDGDTGTNMVLTMQSAYDEIKDSPEKNFGEMAHIVANGALMGARGNSGVILSQIWRGFARGVDTVETLTIEAMVEGLKEARDTAYKGVVRPVEGTILTVIKDIANTAEEVQSETQNPIELLNKIVISADESVQRTPDLLKVLKEAGVVDAGGKGLYVIFEGMLRYINNQPIDKAISEVQPLSALALEESMDTVEPGQDFEVVVDFQPDEPLDLEKFYAELEQMGTSIQIGEGDNMYRMHIHVPTENLYNPIDYTRTLGTVTKVAIENLIAQIEERQSPCDKSKPELFSIESGQIGVVAVVPGTGIARIFASLGVAGIIEGGQTMNPSTHEIIETFEKLPTEKIIILPNNKNILMAAKSAAELSTKQVAVIPSKTIPQGLAAMLRQIPDGDFDAVVDEMLEAINEVVSGEITIATRSVELDGVHVKEGQFIALLNGKMILATDSLENACLDLLDKANTEDYEIITLFYGADLKLQKANKITDLIRSKYPEHEIELKEGCQPHYHFIIGIE
jgi:DAK2 domain fusion protein YloV